MNKYLLYCFSISSAMYLFILNHRYVMGNGLLGMAQYLRVDLLLLLPATDMLISYQCMLTYTKIVWKLVRTNAISYECNFLDLTVTIGEGKIYIK